MKTMRYIFFSLLMPLVFLLQCLFSVEPSETGTLIVTYQTDANRERLDRIRFWLRSETDKQKLYPKGKTYVDEPNELTRKVVVEHLPAGEYWIEFLVPNIDHHFEEVALRKVKVVKEGVAKIDQIIKPRQITTRESSLQETFGHLIVSYETDVAFSQTDHITFTLVDDLGHVTTHPTPGQDTEIILKSGRMIRTQKLPARNYTIEFCLNDDQQQHSFPKRQVTIVANKTKSIHQCLQSPD